MAVLLDTDEIHPRHRADALHAAYSDQKPQRAVFVDHLPIRHRAERVDFGPDAHLLRTAGTPLRIIRTAKQVRTDAPEYVAVGLHRRGETQVATTAHDTDVRDGHLNCVDITRPYTLTHHTFHQHEVLLIRNRQAGVSVDTVRAAAPWLARSPLYDLVRTHVSGLFGAVRGVTDQPRLITGQATIALVRALLTTAAQATDARDAMEEALETRISLYIDAHLGNRELTAERIAATHNISLRHLYNVWARTGHEQTLTQWIIDRRLDRAREDLATLDPHKNTIAAVARRNGFADASHFRRRFREAFGATPREWRSANAPTAASVAAGVNRSAPTDGTDSRGIAYRRRLAAQTKQ